MNVIFIIIVSMYDGGEARYERGVEASFIRNEGVKDQYGSFILT